MATFGEELNRLALTVSVINGEHWASICHDLNTYFTKQVGACYWEICLGGIRIDSEPGLKAIITSEGVQEYTFSLSLDSKNKYKDYRSYAYSKGKPLWIVAKDGMKLKEKNAVIEDKWSDSHEDDEFPKQLPNEYQRSAKTILFNLLNFQGNNFGIFVLEHEELKALTPDIKEEIKLVNLALSRIVRVWQTTKEQIEAVTSAQTNFSQFVNNFSSMADKKKIFIASPGNRDKEVWDSIDAVLEMEKYKDRFQIKKWDEETDPGNVLSKIIENARDSIIGICLFSEQLTPVKTEEGKTVKTAIDNPNVVYEAGIFQAMVNNPERVCKAIIPIREDEKLAGRPFFDISQDRICTIDRDQKNKFLKEAFMKKFEDTIDDALK